MKKFELKLTSALVIAGFIVRAGTKVEVDEPTAKDFIRRGKAVLVHAADAEPEADDETGDGDVNLSRMSKDKLTEVATALEIDVGDMTKAEIIAAIEAHQGE